jgi:UPF0716 protein FxsA
VPSRRALESFCALPTGAATRHYNERVRWLLLLFLVVPLLELYLLVWAGSVFGFWPTMAITLLSAILGGALAKREGLKVWRAWRRALTELRPPEQGVIDGVLVLVGATLLISPGVLTDVVGILFLVPFTRRIGARLIRRALDRRIADGRLRVMSVAPPAGNARWDVVDTSGVSVDDAPVDRPLTERADLPSSGSPPKTNEPRRV